MQKIIVSTLVKANIAKAWEYYTKPEHIVNWNFADASWHCPSAINDMSIGGTYKARMEAKDGSFGFDFEARYTEINDMSDFTYEFGDRVARVTFVDKGDDMTEIEITFDPETENSIELQQEGWQSILNNFKKYVEGD